jgi:hypothetical protein
MGNGALPHGPSYRAHPRLYHSGGKSIGRILVRYRTIADVVVGYDARPSDLPPTSYMREKASAKLLVYGEPRAGVHQAT